MGRFPQDRLADAQRGRSIQWVVYYDGDVMVACLSDGGARRGHGRELETGAVLSTCGPTPAAAAHTTSNARP